MIRIARKRTRYYICGENSEAGWWKSYGSAWLALRKLPKEKTK